MRADTEGVDAWVEAGVFPMEASLDEECPVTAFQTHVDNFKRRIVRFRITIP